MTPQTTPAFNGAAASRLFFINLNKVKGTNTGADLSEKTLKTMEAVLKLARETGFLDKVKVKSGGPQLDKIGLFYMESSEKFAKMVEKLEDVSSVQKPAAIVSKKTPRRSNTYNIHIRKP